MAVQRDKVIASAEKLVAKGKIEPAIKEYERLLDENQNDVNTLNRIGDLWVRINRNDEAVKVFGRIADHYSRDGFFLKAIAIFKKINKLDPSKLDIYAKLADLYAKQGLAMEAKSQYQVLADYYLKHGDPAGALTIYRKISELDPNSINVHVKLADLYSQNNQTAEALKEYDRVGRMLLKRGMLEEAVQVFRKALKIDASNIDLVDSLVAALLEARDFDNSIQIIETALESNRDHPRLIALWGKAFVAKGDLASARSALESGLLANPNDTSIRETLAELYLRQGGPDRALDLLGPSVDAAAARGDGRSAAELLNRVLRADSGNIAALEKLVSVYTRVNEETNILASMNSLAEAHIARGNYEAAAGVLEKLIAREPQNAQHRTKLAFVKQQIGGVDTIPAHPKAPAAAPPAPPPSAPSEQYELDTELSLELDASEPIELDVSKDIPGSTAPPPQIVEAPPVRAMAVPEEEDEDLDFVTEHLTEAEVFAKYGLIDKAAEHLRTVINRAPKHLPAYDKLFRVFLDEGMVDQAREVATTYINLLNEKGDTAEIDVVENEFRSRGHLIQAPRKAPPPAKAASAAPPPPAKAAPAAPPPPAKAAPAAAPPPPPIAEPEPPEVELELETELESAVELEPLEPEPEPLPELEPPREPQIERPGIAEKELTFDLETGGNAALLLEEQEAIEPSPPPAAFELEVPVAEPFFGVEGLSQPSVPMAEEGPAAEEIGEIDFYIEQELFDDAREKVNALLGRYPESAELQLRAARIEEAARSAAAPMPPDRPRELSPIDIENELLSAIPDDDVDFNATIAPPPPPPPKAVAPPPTTVEAAHEENLFADEDAFFDLAAELEEELSEEDETISLSEEEQSLEEIFKEFKKGVEQQLDSEDYDTHYNLGIAYKEMGLIDEGIGEFQLASKDPKRAVECASMLGLCFLEKGMPQLAIKWYRKGLEMPEITEEEHIGLLYDLGSAHMEVGDTQNAHKAFLEVYGLNSTYRDIVSRMKELEDVRQ